MGIGSVANRVVMPFLPSRAERMAAEVAVKPPVGAR